MEENSVTLMSEDIENVEEETTEENTQEEEVELTENEEVEEQPQENGRFYTDEEFNRRVNEAADRRVARKMRKVNQEMDSYKDTINVLKSQIGGESVEEVNSNLRKLYTDNGNELPAKYVSEDKDYIQYQAQRDSEDIIAEGFNYIQEETDKLYKKGYENLTEKEKIIFTNLVEALNKESDIKALKGLNVDTSILEDKDFMEFREQFNTNVPITKIYEMFSGKKENKINTPGNLENNSKAERDYFTDEEIENLSDEDFDNPEIWEKVRRSQTRNK